MFPIRRVFITLLCCAALVLQGGVATAAALTVPPPPPTLYSFEQLQDMMQSRTRTGLGVDAIPALSRPEFLSVSDASLSMEHDEHVFIVEYPTGLVRIYPQRIMVWHEVVNDVLPDPSGAVIRKDTPLSALDGFTITYCPLTGSVNAFYALAGRYPTSFGVSGELYNSNTLLYDRSTRSTWSQITMTCIDGPLAGKRLSPIQVLWSTWRGAMQRYPDAQVLSRSTGYRRSYGRDPYGSYLTQGNYYDDLRILFPMARFDNRLPPKKRILGLEIGGMFGAVDKDAVREARVVNLLLGLTPLVAIYDQTLGTVRIFDPRADGPEALQFEIFENKIIDRETRSEWDEEGNCTYGRLRGRTLKPVYSMDSMWFAWSAFYPQTIILPEKEFVRQSPGAW
ncbi:DUF3179 domain-containing protein [Desulfovibrio sp. OttesenSCG-928-I05]|nr:DUF3179 domain-containing protein [Desulfovibrio sp. OttesenSCG-928-I05]